MQEHEELVKFEQDSRLKVMEEKFLQFQLTEKEEKVKLEEGIRSVKAGVEAKIKVAEVDDGYPFGTPWAKVLESFASLNHTGKICVDRRCVLISGEHLFQIYRRLIGRPYIALARQDKIYRNISVALGRLRSDHEYFSMHPNNNTSQCIAEKMRMDPLK